MKTNRPHPTKRYIADMISAGNLLCGLTSIGMAYLGHLEISLLLLLIGGALDGLDGAAARRWGGTSLGVLADDVADGVNYGLAPALAIYFTLGGIEGGVIGALFFLFTLSRLVYFTLNKENADPNHFNGVPSTVGGIVVLSSLILFPQMSALVGVMVGTASALMVSFDTAHKHMGRALARHREWLRVLPALVISLSCALLFFGPTVPVALLLSATLAYGFWPTYHHFKACLAANRLARSS